MPAPFAALEARLSARVIARLANIEASIDHEPPVPGIFDATYTDPYGVASTEPRFVCRASDVPYAVQGSELVITADNGDQTAYVVRTFEPNGTGLVRMGLARR